MRAIKPVFVSGREVLPLIEGGKGIGVSSGLSAGAWAKAGGVGTFSGVNPDYYDEGGRFVEATYHSKTRAGKHQELIAHSISGGIAQARIAHDVAGGQGRLHMNVLWEMGGAEAILHGVLQGSKGLIHGITCGAGMPYKLADIAAEYGIYYYPIVSSARAFSALWKRSYSRHVKNLGGVVYEDPWLAGGHNGLSNSEDPLMPQEPYERVVQLRSLMRQCGLDHVPIIMAGGVWALNEWEDWLDNKDIGLISFQFGTRPLLTVESPISQQWKDALRTIEAGDVLLHRFSPTGFYSSAVRNSFLQELVERSERQIVYASSSKEDLTAALPVGARGRVVFVRPLDLDRVKAWIEQGFTDVLRTPDSSLIFVTPERAQKITKDQADCMGCLSQCLFSNWSQNEEGTTGKKADPRSFCIQKTLQNIVHGADVVSELMFSGHNAYRFALDPYYNHGFTPTVAQLVERLMQGN